MVKERTEGRLINRREFAVTAGASAVALALSGCASDDKEPSGNEAEELEDSVALAQQQELEKFTVTSGYNCCYCTLQGYKRDGKIVRIEPGELPNMPERNHACQRCMAFPSKVTDESARVMYPMKRTGERGSGEFERISWDEAIDLVAEKLNAAMAKDPRSASFYVFTGNMNMLCWMAPARMAHCLGASTWAMEGIMSDHAASVGLTLVTGNPDPGHDAADYLNSKMLLFFGCNAADTIVPSIRWIARAKENGARFIVIDPRLSSTAVIADQWIPINPGTDPALALAMMNVIIGKDMHDKTWLANYSVAPFLVSDETGQYLRTDEGKFCAWDTATDAMVELDPADFGGADDNTSGPESTLALTGSFKANGVACHTAMDALVAEVQKWTPAKAAEITGIDAGTIEQLAIDYASAQPAAIQCCTGSSRYYYGYETPRALATLSGLCGYTGRAGGGCSRNNGGAPLADGGGVDFTGQGAALFNSEEWDVVGDGESFGTFAVGILSLYGSDPEAFKNAGVYKTSEMYDAAVTGNPVPIDFLYIATANFINMSPDAHRIIDEMFPAIDFIVTADPFWTWTAKYSDVVLPTTTWLECWDYSTQGQYVRVNKPIIAPMGESKSDTEIMSMLAKRVGVEDYWAKSDEEWVRSTLISEHPAFEGSTIDGIIEAGIWARKDGVYDRATYPLGDKKFATPTGRLEFYTESLYQFGDHVPTYLRENDNPENKFADKYPLNFLQYHSRRQVHSQHSGVDLLNVIESEPHLHIHPEDAAARGIANDDVVRIFNDRGECKAKALVTPGIIKGTTTMSQGWAPEDFIEGHYQFLTHYVKNPVEEFISMTNAALYDVRIEVEKA